jgi:hypothetical protein
MNAYEEADDKIVRQINKNFELGWSTTDNLWRMLGTAIAKRQEARDQPVWGIREGYAPITGQGKEILTPTRVALVANAWAFHPLATPIRDVTYDEAIALHKLKN